MELKETETLYDRIYAFISCIEDKEPLEHRVVNMLENIKTMLKEEIETKVCAEYWNQRTKGHIIL